MSLVSSDADGEQNEIRNLQEKLESTMKLVTNLSSQLTELKEQVGSNRNPSLTQTRNASVSRLVAGVARVSESRVGMTSSLLCLLPTAP